MANPAGPCVINQDLVINGQLTCTSFIPPVNSILDASVPVGAAIQYTKLEQEKHITYGQPNTTATTEARGIHVVRGASGTVIDIGVGAIVANIGAATITLDVKKNGTSILTTPLILTNATAAYALLMAAIATSALVLNDVLTIHITATAGGGTLATGYFICLRIRELPQ